MNYNRSLVFAAACIGMLLFGIVLISLGSILPELILKYKLDEVATGSLASVLPLGILAGSLVFGPIVDRYGYKSLLIVNALLVMAGLEGIAFAGSLFILQLSVFWIGFGGGVINGGVSALVSDISAADKGANLSLLGVFFGIGALGMPLLLGSLTGIFDYQAILAGVGLSVAAPILFFALIRFPAAKHDQALPLKESIKIIREPTLLIFGLFLFFQGGVEGLINNWTTTYLENALGISSPKALFALSSFVGALTVTRLLLGGLLKRVSSFYTLFYSIIIAVAGCVILLLSPHYTQSVVGLILLGAGVAGCFPIILGFVGSTYASLSGTAFSIVLALGLIGNMLINFLMGLTANSYGIKQLPLLLLINLIVLLPILLIMKTKLSERN